MVVVEIGVTHQTESCTRWTPVAGVIATGGEWVGAGYQSAAPVPWSCQRRPGASGTTAYHVTGPGVHEAQSTCSDAGQRPWKTR